MKSHLLLALRNLARNRRRAVTALLTISISVICILLAEGFIHWIFWAMREGIIQSQLGHIQVVRPGYNKSGSANPFAYILRDTNGVLREIASTQGVKTVAPRLAVTGLVSKGEHTVSFIADATDPAKEAELSKAFRIVDGKNLLSVQASEVVIGKGLARNLGVKAGDTVVLLANTATRGINAVEAKVAGIFITGSQAYDDAALRLPLAFAQTLLRTNGEHAWLILLDETDKTDVVLRQLRERFPSDTSKLEFVPWYDRADFYNKTVTLFSSQMQVVRLIISIVIVLSISNLLIMNVLERTGEIGTMLAIGYKRKEILRLFATEGLVLGFLGGAIGLALGYGLAELISHVGIPMPPPPGMEEGYTARIRLNAVILIGAFFTAFLTTALAAVYPAWKASRLNIVDALRHNI
ncbi:MAG: ABC transporter permease [Burkholderiales bacterium]